MSRPPHRYIQALGWMTMAWALFETSIDMLVATTFQRFGGKERHKEIPRSMMRKIEYLRERAKSGEIDQWAKRVRSIADLAAELKERRHDAAHGAVSHFESETALLYRMVYDRQIHRTRDVAISAEELSELSNEIRAAARLTSTLVHEMLDFLGYPTDDPGR